MLRNMPCAVLAVVTALLVVSTSPAYGADDKTAVALTAQQVMPGAQAYVTIMLTNVPGADLSGLEQWVEFPKEKLLFVGARLSIAGDLAEAELKSELQDGTGQPATGESASTAGGQKQEGAAGSEPERKPGETQGAGVGAGNQGSMAVLHITIKAKRPIPDGPIAELMFSVPGDLAEQVVPLGHKADAFAPDGKKMADITVEPGEVKVSKEPPEKAPAIMSCFFYMH